jgi:hypothetical protein
MRKILRPAGLALALAACVSTGGPSTTAGVPSATATTGVPVTVPAVEQFAFVRSIDESQIRYDPATMLTGEEATAAARAEGVLGEGETLPNDYYISNPDEAEIAAGLDSGGNYILIGFDANGALADRQLSAEEFVGALNSPGVEEFYGIIPGEVPMILTLQDGTVVGARQQYLP